MSSKNIIHDFSKSLEWGQAGEIEFIKLWPELTRENGREYDFILPNGETVELKTDNYDMQRTENFFMERWSSWADKKPGGVWQSKATYFVYYFIKNQTAFVFDTIKLRHYLDTQKYGGIQIKNKGWTTVGFKVPRKELESFIIKILTIQGASK